MYLSESLDDKAARFNKKSYDQTNYNIFPTFCKLYFDISFLI